MPQNEKKINYYKIKHIIYVQDLLLTSYIYKYMFCTSNWK